MGSVRSAAEYSAVVLLRGGMQRLHRNRAAYNHSNILGRISVRMLFLAGPKQG